jgi:hypothetical protein
MEHQELGKRKRVPRNYDYFCDKQQLATKPKKSIKQTVTFDSNNTYYHDNNMPSTTIMNNETSNINPHDGMMMSTSTTSANVITNTRQRRNSKKIDIITSSTKVDVAPKRVPKKTRKGVPSVLVKRITKGMSKKMKKKIIKQNAKLKNNKKLKKKGLQPPKVVVIEAPKIDERLISYIPLKVELSKSDIACQLLLSDDCLTCYGSEVT